MTTPTPSIPEKPLYVDINFTPPAGARNIVFVENGLPLGMEADNVTGDSVSGSNPNTDDSETIGGLLAAPTGLSVLSQTVHQGTGKTQVVDVVIGFNDVPGATKYNIRISKA